MFNFNLQFTIDIYFNFIGNYSMPEKELSEAEKAEMECVEAIKDKRQQQYLSRKAMREGMILFVEQDCRSLNLKILILMGFLLKNMTRSIFRE